MTTQDLTLRAARVTYGLAARALALVGAYFQRRKFKRLRDLDVHILDDIGVTRAEVEIATRLPFTHDAATELRRLSLERRRFAQGKGYPLDRYAAAGMRRSQTPRRWR